MCLFITLILWIFYQNKILYSVINFINSKVIFIEKEVLVVMKKIMLAITLLFLLLFCACSGQKEQTQGSDSNTNQQECKVGVLI